MGGEWLRDKLQRLYRSERDTGVSVMGRGIGWMVFGGGNGLGLGFRREGRKGKGRAN